MGSCCLSVVDDNHKVLNRAPALVARFEEGPNVNPNTQTREFSLVHRQ